MVDKSICKLCGADLKVEALSEPNESGVQMPNTIKINNVQAFYCKTCNRIQGG